MTKYTSLHGNMTILIDEQIITDGINILNMINNISVLSSLKGIHGPHMIYEKIIIDELHVDIDATMYWLKNFGLITPVMQKSVAITPKGIKSLDLSSFLSTNHLIPVRS